jgi:hypothetical protein
MWKSLVSPEERDVVSEVIERRKTEKKDKESHKRRKTFS